MTTPELQLLVQTARIVELLLPNIDPLFMVISEEEVRNLEDALNEVTS